MSKKYRISIAFLITIILMVVIGVIVFNKMNEGIEVLIAEELPEIDLTSIEDGTYLGQYAIPLISVKVEVTVLDHQITDIVILEHKNGQGEDGELIINDVILEQSIEIDYIVGATYSSKAILLAIGDALKS
ncbi:MAG: FMN-binding protein [Acholeplasmataceae bacterium]